MRAVLLVSAALLSLTSAGVSAQTATAPSNFYSVLYFNSTSFTKVRDETF